MKMILVTLMLAVLSSALFAGVMPPADEMTAIDTMIDKMMTAYNTADSVAFYADWASMMAAVCTPQAFQMLYIDNYKKTFGDYTTREIITDETVVMADVPNGLLSYSAVFTNNDKVKMSVNIFKEDGTWKIQQVTIQAMP